jgi:sarcosine oxidase
MSKPLIQTDQGFFMRIAVVGRGLIGSAAARHLTLMGHEVTLIGPSEPTEFATHNGPFGSHYDEGRITRGLDPYPFWSRVSLASISRYRDIEAASGVPFFNEVGAMMSGPADSDYVHSLETVMAGNGVMAERFDGAEIAARFPYFQFPDDTRAYYQPKEAGHISPRNLVRAQGIAATRGGAQIIDAEVLDVRDGVTGAVIKLAGQTLRFDRAIVAAGGFTNKLMDDALPLTVYARTVAMFRVTDAEAARLAWMPSLIHVYPTGEDPYLLPAIKYPDGHHYLKIGGDRVDIELTNDEDMRDWFRSGGSVEVGEMLTDMIRDRMPDLAIQEVVVKPCVTTFTPHNHPIIDMLGNHIVVAVAGCGRGAKNSDELGRLAAEAVMGRTDPDTRVPV